MFSAPPDRSVSIGDRARSRETLDLQIPAEILGASRAILVDASVDPPRVNVPSSGVGWTLSAGTEPIDALAGRSTTGEARERVVGVVPLRGGQTILIELGNIWIDVGQVDAESIPKGVASGVTPRWIGGYFVSLAVHLALAGSSWVLTKPDNAESSQKESQVWCQNILKHIAAREEDAEPQPAPIVPRLLSPIPLPPVSRSASGPYSPPPARLPPWEERRRLREWVSEQLQATLFFQSRERESLLHPPEAPWGRRSAEGLDPAGTVAQVGWAEIELTRSTTSLRDSALSGQHFGIGEAIGVTPIAGLVSDANRSASHGSNDPAAAGVSRARIRTHIAETGPLTEPMVRAAVGSAMPLYRACYQDALRAVPSLSGRVAYDLDVDLDGRVTQIRDRYAELSDPRMTACVGAVLANVVFPAPESKNQAVVVTFAFDLL